MTDLSSKTKRRRLAVRAAPHYQKLAKGLQLGWRNRTGAPPMKWICKIVEGGKAQTSVLGDAEDGDWAGGLTFEEAADKARQRAGAPRLLTDLTVKDALEDWRDWKCETASSGKAISTYHSETKTLSEALGSIRLADLKSDDIEGWRRKVLRASNDQRKAKAGLNRRLATLKAALNRAVPDGPKPWASVAKYEKSESFAARIRVLTKTEEQALLAACPADLGRFVTFLGKTGARPGEAAAVQIENIVFSDGGAWITTTGKVGERTFRVPADFAAIIKEWKGDRRKGPLLLRDDGLDWGDGRHVKLFAKAAKAAKVSNVTAYAYRDTFISRALRSGASLSAVAKHAGTSPEQIMKSYFSELPAEQDAWLAIV